MQLQLFRTVGWQLVADESEYSNPRIIFFVHDLFKAWIEPSTGSAPILMILSIVDFVIRQELSSNDAAGNYLTFIHTVCSSLSFCNGDALFPLRMKIIKNIMAYVHRNSSLLEFFRAETLKPCWNFIRGISQNYINNIIALELCKR